jgi:hypothetical protein
MAELVSELEAQPQRVTQIRQNNIIQSLRRHDWAHRWRQILDCVGLPTTTRLVKRARGLNYVAQACDVVSFRQLLWMLLTPACSSAHRQSDKAI